MSREFTFKHIPAATSGHRTRPFLKIQDGCDAYCTYCIVPYARGRSRSMPPQNVIENISRLSGCGYHEVVLCGIHLGCYGLDLSPPTSLPEVLKQLDAAAVIEHVRLSSIEPHELTDEIIRLVAHSEHICRHFHIPLQSGDNFILGRMRRPYTREFFRDLVLKIHAVIPNAAIGVDILLGFPGETQAAFDNTYTLVEELPITYLHVFPFSARKGTPAHRYSPKVSSQIIKSRCRRMRQLGIFMKSAFYHKFIGKTLPLLIENKRDASGLLKGVTSNYLPVLVSGEDKFKNTLTRVRIDTLKDNLLFGTICP